MPHGRGPNYLVFRQRHPAGEHEQLGADLPGTAHKPASSRSTTSQIFIADAAALSQGDAARPRHRRIRTSSTQDQFNAAVDLLRKQKPDIGKYWDGVTYADQVTAFKSGETTVGTTWPYQVSLMAAEKPPLT